MDFQKLMEVRYSVRAYKSDPVPEKSLSLVLDAARIAPTAANRQPFQILVIHTAGRQEELRRIYNRDWFVQAPLILGICALSDEAWKRKHDNKCYADVDAAIAFDHMIMAATGLGLGTCWIAAFDPAAAREILKLPNNVEPVVFTPLGYPADKSTPKQRKKMEELVRYENWDNLNANS
jgi:nitroreductase